jgi:hypothetical protein
VALDTLPPTGWTIIAISQGMVGSVAFNLDGNVNYRVNSNAPWSLTDNVHTALGDEYAPWNPTNMLGEHTLIATPYLYKEGGGTVGAWLSLQFTVQATAPVPAPTVPAPVPTIGHSDAK